MHRSEINTGSVPWDGVGALSRGPVASGSRWDAGDILRSWRLRRIANGDRSSVRDSEKGRKIFGRGSYVKNRRVHLWEGNSKANEIFLVYHPVLV